MLADSHAHLSTPDLKEEGHALLQRAQEAGVDTIVNICTTPEELLWGKQLHQHFPQVYNVAATTPHDVQHYGEKHFASLAASARNQEIVAVGETGLDAFYAHSPLDMQKEFFRRYLTLALECALPVVVHCRDAFADLLEIIDQDYRVKGKHAPGVVHCFTGTLSEAEALLKRGWYLSLSGIVTFKKNDWLREVARELPLESLFLETDAPYLAPQKYRGKRNEPAYLVETARCIAEIKNISFEEVATMTTENVYRFFSL